MCRSRHDDPSGGAIDVTKGREVLPDNVVPRHYDVTLEPKWDDFTFEGSVIIEYVEGDGLLGVHSILANSSFLPTSRVKDLDLMFKCNQSPIFHTSQSEFLAVANLVCL